jgi:hypothetical protein
VVLGVCDLVGLLYFLRKIRWQETDSENIIPSQYKCGVTLIENSAGSLICHIGLCFHTTSFALSRIPFHSFTLSNDTSRPYLTNNTYQHWIVNRLLRMPHVTYIETVSIVIEETVQVETEDCLLVRNLLHNIVLATS